MRTVDELLSDTRSMLFRVCWYWFFYVLLGLAGALWAGGLEALARQQWRELIALHLAGILVLTVVLGLLRPWLSTLVGAVVGGVVAVPMIFAVGARMLQPTMPLREVLQFSLAIGGPLGAIYGVVAWLAHRRVQNALK